MLRACALLALLCPAAAFAPSVRPRAAQARVAVVARAAGGDAYADLGVTAAATAAEVKRAYRRQALKYHPDVDGSDGAVERFQRIVTAYETLSDPSKRAAYDRRGSGGSWRPRSPSGSRARPPPRSSSSSSSSSSGWRPPRPGDDIPSPEELGDSFGSILSDLFSADGSGTGRRQRFAEDLMEFLERRVDPLDDTLGDLDDLVSADELKAELENARLMASQLKGRVPGLAAAVADANEKLALARRQAKRKGAAEVEAEIDLAAAAAAATAKLTEVQAYAARADRRAASIERRMARPPPEPRASSAASGRNSAPPHRRQPGQGAANAAAKKRAVDDELERMRKEMGL
jgi:hypothetical protein